MQEPRSNQTPKWMKLFLKGLFALLVSLAALWWAFRDVDLGYVRDNLSRTTVGMVVIYCLSLLVIHAVRVARYWLLVEPLGRAPGAKPPSWRAVFAAMSVGIPASVFLPLRLGELVRPLMIARSGAPIAGAFASVVVERVADGLFNVGLFFALLSLLPATAKIPPELRSVALVMLVFFGGGLVFLTAAYFMRARVLGLFERLVGRVAPELAKKLVVLISTFLDGLTALGSPLRGLAFLGLTMAYWGVNGYSTYLLARSYGLDVPPIAGSFAVTCVVFAVTVPAGPAFAGTLEAGFLAGLAPFGVSSSDSALVAIAVHVLQLLALAMFAGLGFLSAESKQRVEAAHVASPGAPVVVAGVVPGEGSHDAP